MPCSPISTLDGPNVRQLHNVAREEITVTILTVIRHISTGGTLGFYFRNTREKLINLSCATSRTRQTFDQSKVELILSYYYE